MKMIVTYIRSEQLPAVRDALSDAGFGSLSAMPILGTAPKSEQRMFRGVPLDDSLFRRVRIELVLRDDEVEKAIAAISAGAKESGGYETQLVRRTGRSIASFGEDDAGELYITSFDGGLYQVVGSDEPENALADWPALLSESGLYASMKDRKLSDHLIPYEVNAAFWSDGAAKSRFIELPGV